MQKRICIHCHKQAKDHHRVKLYADGKLQFICETCLDANREAMLADPNHPAWQYYEAVAKALGFAGKAKTDD